MTASVVLAYVVCIYRFSPHNLVSWCREAVGVWHSFFSGSIWVCSLICNLQCWRIRIHFCFELPVIWNILSLFDNFSGYGPIIDFAIWIFDRTFSYILLWQRHSNKYYKCLVYRRNAQYHNNICLQFVIRMNIFLLFNIFLSE